MHVVREPAPAVDLDDRQPFPVLGLEHRVVRDVDLVELEPELGPEAAHDVERTLAQMATVCVVHGDMHDSSNPTPAPRPRRPERKEGAGSAGARSAKHILTFGEPQALRTTYG